MGVTQVTMADLRGMGSLSSPAMKRAEMAKLKAAAEIIAAGVRDAAAEFSDKIPQTVKVTGGVSGAYITCGGNKAPSAYPNEYGKQHPLFGNRGYWYATPSRPFIEQGVDLSADEAAEVFSTVIDDWMDALGI